MSGSVLIEQSGALVRVTLSNPGKLNAMSRAMWPSLRRRFEAIQQDTNIRCVWIRGEGGQFCAGGDISEYADFRFDEASLRDFHEGDVWGGLQAMLGFPMAPREAALVCGAVGELTAREMLLTAKVLDAHEMMRRGFLNSVLPEAEISRATQDTVANICGLAAAAARLNKQSFRALQQQKQGLTAMKSVANAYHYADTAEHREGVTAFVEKRPPQFL